MLPNDGLDGSACVGILLPLMKDLKENEDKGKLGEGYPEETLPYIDAESI